MDGDQLVDFYWIDPMMAAERIAGKSKCWKSREAQGAQALERTTRFIDDFNKRA